MIRIFPFFLFHRLSFHIIFDSPFPLFSISLAVASFLKAFFQRSSPLLGRFISMFSSPPLPPPLFHPKHISQPRLSASLTSYPPCPPPHLPPVLTSPLLFRRCRPPWSLRSLSSPFHLFQIPRLHCLPMPLLHSSVCASVCVFGVRSTHTPIGCSPFIPSDSTGWSGQGEKKWKPSRRRRCIPLSCCVSYHCWTHGRAQMPERTAARHSRSLAQTHKHALTSLKKTTKPSARNKSRTFQWEAEFAASQNRSLTILNVAWLQLKGGEYINGHAVWVEGFSICSAKCFGCDFSFCFSISYIFHHSSRQFQAEDPHTTASQT